MITENELHVFNDGRRGEIAKTVNTLIKQIEDKIADCRKKYPIAQDRDFDDIRRKLNTVRTRLTKKTIQIAFIADPQTGKSTLINRLFIPTPPVGEGFVYYNNAEQPEVLATSGRNAQATTSCIVSYTIGCEPRFIVEPFAKKQKEKKYDDLLKICRKRYENTEDESEYIDKIEADREGKLAKWLKIKQFLLYGKPNFSIDQAKLLAQTRKNTIGIDDVPQCSDDHFALSYAEGLSERKLEDRSKFNNLSVSQNALSQLIYKIRIEGLGSSANSHHYTLSGNNVSVSQKVTLVDVPGFNADPCDQYLFDEYLNQEIPEADGYVFLLKPTQPGGITVQDLYEKIKNRSSKYGLAKTFRIALGISRFDQVDPHYVPKEVGKQHLLETYKTLADGWELASEQVFLLGLGNTGTDANTWTKTTSEMWLKLHDKLENGVLNFFKSAIMQLYEPGNGGVNALRNYINGQWLERIVEENYEECLFDIEVARKQCDNIIQIITHKSSLTVDQKQQIIEAKGKVSNIKASLRRDCSFLQEIVREKREEIYNIMRNYRKQAPVLGLPASNLSEFIKMVVGNLFQKSLMGILVPACLEGKGNGDCPVEGMWKHVSDKLDAPEALKVPYLQSNGQIESTELSVLWNRRYIGLSNEGKRAINTACDDPIPLIADCWGSKLPSLKNIIRGSIFLNQFMKSAFVNIDAISEKIASGLDSEAVREILFALVFAAIDDVFSESANILLQFVLHELDAMSLEITVIGN